MTAFEWFAATPVANKRLLSSTANREILAAIKRTVGALKIHFQLAFSSAATGELRVVSAAILPCSMSPDGDCYVVGNRAGIMPDAPPQGVACALMPHPTANRSYCLFCDQLLCPEDRQWRLFYVVPGVSFACTQCREHWIWERRSLFAKKQSCKLFLNENIFRSLAGDECSGEHNVVTK